MKPRVFCFSPSEDVRRLQMAGVLLGGANPEGGPQQVDPVAGRHPQTTPPPHWLDLQAMDVFLESTSMASAQRNDGVDVLCTAEQPLTTAIDDGVDVLCTTEQPELLQSDSRRNAPEGVANEERHDVASSQTQSKREKKSSGTAQNHSLPSLRSVVKKYIGKTIEKTEQTSDWHARPLSSEQVKYAALDAEVLFEVADAMAAESGRRGVSCLLGSAGGSTSNKPLPLPTSLDGHPPVLLVMEKETRLVRRLRSLGIDTRTMGNSLQEILKQFNESDPFSSGSCGSGAAGGGVPVLKVNTVFDTPGRGEGPDVWENCPQSQTATAHGGGGGNRNADGKGRPVVLILRARCGLLRAGSGFPFLARLRHLNIAVYFLDEETTTQNPEEDRAENCHATKSKATHTFGKVAQILDALKIDRALLKRDYLLSRCVVCNGNEWRVVGTRAELAVVMEKEDGRGGREAKRSSDGRKAASEVPNAVTISDAPGTSEAVSGTGEAVLASTPASAPAVATPARKEQISHRRRYLKPFRELRERVPYQWPPPGCDLDTEDGAALMPHAQCVGCGFSFWEGPPNPHPTHCAEGSAAADFQSFDENAAQQFPEVFS